MSQHRVMKKQLHFDIITSICAALLVLLCVYTAVSKLIDFDSFKEQMNNQGLYYWMTNAVIWLLPVTELFTAILLMIQKWRAVGFIISFFLLLAFTGYIAFRLIAGGEMPCSCGGVFKSMDWTTHLLFNIFFLLLSLIGIYIINRERRVTGN